MFSNKNTIIITNNIDISILNILDLTKKNYYILSLIAEKIFIRIRHSYVNSNMRSIICTINFEWFEYYKW